MNIVILHGAIRSEPARRMLKDGRSVFEFDIDTERDGARLTAPVVWADPPQRSEKLVEGLAVVVVGTVARRFFRTGPSTQMRTEVRADVVWPASQRRRCETATAAALSEVHGSPQVNF